jgi:hypothetical protein
MPQFLPVGVAAGLTTALLLASASAGGMTGRIILFFLAPLPSYLAGLGWGVAAAGVAAITSAALAAALLGVQTGAVFLATQGVPMVALCHLVSLSRPASSITGGPAASAPLLEWYPIGRVVAAATLMAGALSLVSILLLGADLEALRTLMRQLVDDVLVKQMPGLGGAELADTDKDALAGLMLYALPAGTAVLWLGGFVLNLWLAGKVTLLSGRLSRPWPHLSLMRFPSGFGLGLAGSVALSMLPGLPGLLATGFAGAFLFAYMLMGLAIIHHLTRGLTARPLILWAVYLILIVFNTTAALVVALVAVLEPLLWYRRPEHPDQGPASPPSAPPT